MKKLAMALMLLTGIASANPYFYVYPVTKGSNLNLSTGVLFDSQMNNAGSFTNVALIYHPLSSGSIIPQQFQAFIPPESWAINCGGGYTNGVGRFGCGPAINLLDSVRAWASNLLKISNNTRLIAIGNQIAPGNGPLNLLVSYEPTADVFINGQFARNPLKFSNHWFFGPSYSF